MDRKFFPLVSGLAFVIVSGGAEYELSGGTSGWIPLVAGVAGAVAGWLVLYCFPPAAGSQVDLVRLAANSQAGPVGPAADSQAAPVAPVVKRSASELMDLVSGSLTSVEAENIIRPHIGSVIEVCGEVTNVSETSAGSVSLFFWIGEMRLLCAGLDPSCADEGRRLRVGDRVCVSGKITEIKKLRFLMESCRFTPPDEPDRS